MKTRAFGICSKDSNAMKSDNPRSGFYEAETSKTIDTSCQCPGRNQGGMAVIEESPVYTTSKSSHHTRAETDAAGTLVASDWKDPPTVAKEPYCAVRRLTPTECARLQGMPDWWCRDLETPEPSDEDLAFWRGVFDSWQSIVSPGSRPRSDEQIRKWLKSPHSDSAEYRLWGNGIAAPCAVFVLSGICHYSEKNAEKH